MSVTGLNEVDELRLLENKPVWKRVPAYIRMSGPGWLQGTMTLGGGSAITSLTIGSVYGYDLLWVQPLSMIVGCVMLFALSHQTLSTGQKPFAAMRDHVSSTLAWLWTIAALASSVIWGFSHYPLGAGMLEDVVQVVTGFQLKGEGQEGIRDLYLLVLAAFTWFICAFTVWNYANGGRTVRLFENAIKLLSGMIILSFAVVVVRASIEGQINWLSVLGGFVPGRIPTDSAGVTTIMAALGTAVGINMTFVYGYTLLNRGWGKEHRTLSRYDIILGLVIPYILVTGLISIVAAGALHGSDMPIQGKLSPAEASGMFVAAGLGPAAGRLLFSLGVYGMALGSLVMHMLTCGAAMAEMFRLPLHSFKYKLACLIPTPAVLGVFVWSTMGAYVVLPTSAICGYLLPLAYIGWFILNNRESYLGEDKPGGQWAFLYNSAMLLCIGVVLASVMYTVSVKLGFI